MVRLWLWPQKMRVSDGKRSTNSSRRWPFSQAIGSICALPRGQEGGCGGFTKVVGIPGEILDVIEQHGGGVIRPAASHHRHVVNLGDGVDQRGGDHKAQRRAQQR